MPEEIFENEETTLTENHNTKVNENIEEKEDENKKTGLVINIFEFHKWKKYQELSIFDFSSLQGTFTSALLIAVIALAVKCAKLSKRK